MALGIRIGRVESIVPDAGDPGLSGDGRNDGIAAGNRCGFLDAPDENRIGD